MSYFALAISFLAGQWQPCWCPPVPHKLLWWPRCFLCLNLFLNTYMNAYAVLPDGKRSPGLEKLHRSAVMMGRGPHSPFGVPMGFPGMSQEDEDQEDREDREDQDQQEPEDQERDAGSRDEPEADPGDQPGDEPSRDAAPPEDPGKA